METRLDTFNGWQMRVTVGSRPATRGVEYYIVKPVAYREFSTASGIQANPRGPYGPFGSSDAAFDAAFESCRFVISREIKLRGFGHLR